MKNKNYCQLKKYKSAGWLAAGAVAVAGPVLAQDSDGVTEVVTVTAHLTETDRAHTASSVSVITFEDLEAQKLRDLSDVLRTVPGLNVQSNGGRGKFTTLSLRGAESGQTVILIDGVRVNGNQEGTYSGIAYLSPDNIERIEVLRGPQSTLFGSDAMGGVISITTKRGTDEFQPSVTAEYGTNESYHAGFSAAGGNESVDFNVSIYRDEADEVFAAEESTNPEEDPFRSTGISGRVGFDLRDELRIDLTGRLVDGETETDAFSLGAPTDGIGNLSEHDEYQFSFAAEKPLSDRWRIKGNIGIQSLETQGSGPTDSDSFLIETSNMGYRFQADLRALETTTFSLGLEGYEQEGSSASGGYDVDRRINSVFSEAQFRPTDFLTLSAGLRHDDFDDFGEETTYRLTGSYAVQNSGLRLHATYGTGFKAPTFQELFIVFFGVPLGNPDLKPEKSTGYDAGIEWSTGDGRVTMDMTYFHNDFEDLIAFVAFVPRGFENVQQARTKGVEYTIDAALSSTLSVGGSYTYLDTNTDDPANGNELPRRPKNRYAAYADYRPGERIGLRVGVEASRDRFDTNRIELQNYVNVDLTLQYRLKENITTYLRVENLLDDDYQEINGYDIPGMTGFLGVTVRM